MTGTQVFTLLHDIERNVCTLTLIWMGIRLLRH